MSKFAKVVIELNYDKDSFTETLFADEEVSDEDFIEQVEEMVYEDLTDLMRGDKLKHWSEITIVEVEDK